LNANPARALLAVLEAADPSAKVEAAIAARDAQIDTLDLANWPPAPARPGRPSRPILVPPADVERRRLGTPEGRIALLHALAHIEFNAIDLAFDLAVRFAPAIAAEGLDPQAFVKDWAAVGADEARHFRLLCERLSELGAAYGDLPAHGGLWDNAEATADDVLARLAVAPMALEARGLDVTPNLISRLKAVGDRGSATVLDLIYRDEIGHVSSGVRWFQAICAGRELDPESSFRRLVGERLAGGLKPPFNHGARANAGLRLAFYAGTD
jgi:uncharacterized ferritin-like protein (DUF455 family)